MARVGIISRRKIMLSSGQYLFYTGLVYFILGMLDLFWYRFAEPEVLQAVWVVVLALPLLVPMQRIVRIDPLWKR